MKVYTFETEQFISAGLEPTWNFFSSPMNLSIITPPEMDFQVLTHLPDKNIYEGMRIDYSVKPIWGIPVCWQTVIGPSTWLKSFVDIQVKGPYKHWIHTHSFEPVNNGVLMRDKVEYVLPFGLLGRIVHRLFVRRKIEMIFTYRQRTLQTLFNNE